jgi:hypothetical protein
MSQSQHVARNTRAPLFRDDEPVLADVVPSPCFGDDAWNLNALRRNNSEGPLTIDFSSLPVAHSDLVREVLMAVLNPDHPSIKMLRWKPLGRRIRVIGSLFRDLRSLLNELDSLGVDLNQTNQRHLARMLDSWVGKGLSPSSIRKRVMVLRLLRTLDPILTNGGLTFEPWPGRSSRQVTQEQPTSSNSTAPIPWDLWSSLVAGSWLIVNHYSTDIVAAHVRQRELAGAPKNGSVSGATERFSSWLQTGGRVPLHTGFAHRGGGSRGEVNRSLLARLAGIHPNCLRSSHRIYKPEINALIDHATQSQLTTAFGGVFIPTTNNQDGEPWTSEIGLGEAEYLISVLRAACYVIIAALTGMRDSEIQSLERNSICERDGIPALRSTQFKGIDNTAGLQRAWWAPAPAIKAAQVLADLSLHPKFLFARRATGEFSDYAPNRDIPRLLGFLSADPDARPGRGAELGHERRMLVASFDRLGQGKPVVEINQRSLRQSFSIWAARHPEAELGLGIQLGHASLRQTFGYATDRTEAAVRLIDDKRGAALQERARDLLAGPLAGPAGHEFSALAQVLSNEEHESLVKAVGERLYIGLANDCVRNDARAACGPGIPQLHNHNCATTGCSNCLIGPVHAPIWRDQADHLDRTISTITQPDLRERLLIERHNIGRVLSELDERET